MSRSRIAVVGAAIVCVLVVGIGAATRSSDDDVPPTTTTASSVVESTTTAAPTTTSEPPTTTTTTPVAEVVAAGSCPTLPQRRAPDADRPAYDVTVAADPGTGRVTGDLRVRFTPDLPTSRLVFRLWPNGPRPASVGASLAVSDVRVDGAPVRTDSPDPTTLIVAVPGGLEPGDAVEAAMAFDLAVPGSIKDRISRSGDSLRLGSFLPLLAWQPGVGWATEPPTSGFAEATTSPVAAWAVTVEVPDGYAVLASALAGDDGVHRLDAGRDFALSVGRFDLVSATVALPHDVEVVVGVHAGVGESARAYLDRVTAALGDFTLRYGAYPYESYTLAVTPGMTGGIEFPGHVMQGPGSIGRTTPHEVAHMWFYALVGNNQGAAPWLDEGLATFAEGRFEGTLASMQARSIPGSGVGRAGEPMTYWESNQSAYYRSVYVQTAAALAGLGRPEAVDCALAHYVAEHAHRIVTPGEALAHFTRFFPDAPAVLAPFGLPTG